MFRRVPTVALLLALTLSATATALATPASWNRLADGHDGKYSWAVKLGSRSGTSLGREAMAPCLRVAITLHHGRHSLGRSIFRDCAITPATSRRSGPPLLAGGSQLGQSDGAGMTVFGIVSVAAARQVHLIFADGSEATASLKPQQPDSSASRAAGLGDLRYAVLALPGAHCIERMVSRSAGGKTLWEGAPEGHSCSGS
jgi:hypothetical protein